MERDVRDTALYREAEALFKSLRRPGSGLISDAAELSTNGTQVAFAGTLVDTLSGAPPTRICCVDLATGHTRVLTFGPNFDRLPRYAPDGGVIAFLSDRHRADDFQLYLLDPETGEVRDTPAVDGWVEYLHWSPDGKRILLGIAGRGADVAGGQGAVASRKTAQALPSWVPAVESGNEGYRWRRVWVYDLATNTVRQLSHSNCNVWEAVWCGNESVAAVTSSGPGEGLWYSARLHILRLQDGNAREVYAPQDQLGWPAASPSGSRLAVVEAICSDRWIVCGDLRVIDTATGAVLRVDTHGVDVTYAEWRSERHVLVGGHRGFDTVVGLYDVVSNRFSEVWSGGDLAASGRYITLSGWGESSDCVFVAESFTTAPQIGMIRNGEYRVVRSFDLGYAEQATAIAAVERVTWRARDGLDIHGWLLRPKGAGPFPLVMNVHGGPVGHWRPVWLGRRSLQILMLLKRGYAAFFPNPRGGSGRGQAFARHVVGEMGGADTYDCLSGLDHLVDLGIADPRRLGVTGGSYGGYMTSWLITQDRRFAAAVPVAPVTNFVTAHLLSNIPHFVSAFLADSYAKAGGKYHQRSPVVHAANVKTPTLNICGALDRCTPPEEAAQFHNALLENGTKSVLVTYPEEGHGIRKWPAATDFSARVVGWFVEHMPSGTS